MASPPNKRAQSAARATPLAEPPRRVTGEILAAGATDTALNAAGLLRDFWDDFKNSDRYFKYKAAVAVCWLVLSVTSVGVACPSATSFLANSFGARLVVAGDARSPIYMVKNDSAEAWQDVEVVVNGNFRSTAAQIDSQREITLSPVLLFDEQGGRAPADLRITEIEVRIGGDKVVLLEGGKPN